jgi:hypothetical protein
MNVDVLLAPRTYLMPLFFPHFVFLVSIVDASSVPKPDFNLLVEKSGERRLNPFDKTFCQ